MKLRFSPLFLGLLLVGCPSAVDPPPVDPVIIQASTEEVTFEAVDFTLEGTLHLPTRSSGEPLPAVILVHGSGQNSRDETVPGQVGLPFGFTIDVFVEIAEALQASGYVVLRYDKRSCGPFNGLCENDYPLDPDMLVSDFVADAVAGARWLAEHEAVHPDEVFVVGHSQGGATMPAALAAEPTLAGGVSLAGNWRPIDAVLRYQLDFVTELYEADGLTPTQIETQLSSLTQMIEDLEALRAGSFEGTDIGGAGVAFWEDWLAHGDARPGLVAEEQRPMLALFGDYDSNIPADPELDLWADAGVESVLIPCVTHALNCINNPDWQSIQPGDIEDFIDPGVLSALTDWLDEQRAQ
jgi:hypothetical protein